MVILMLVPYFDTTGFLVTACKQYYEACDEFRGRGGQRSKRVCSGNRLERKKLSYRISAQYDIDLLVDC
jgi:hypothetical protein